MGVGHVTLDGRDYMLKPPQAYRRVPANQMAPKLSSSGQSQYGDMTQWDNWVVEDWQMGIGQPADANGLHYGEVDTRIPRQIINPARLEISNTRTLAASAADCRYNPAAITGYYTIGLGDYQKASIYFSHAGGVNLSNVWFYARISKNVSVTWELYAVDANDLPTGSVLATGSFSSLSSDPNFRWYGAPAGTPYSISTEHALVVYPTNEGETFDLAYSSAYTNAVTGQYNGTSWSADTTHYPPYLTDLYGLATGAAVDFVRFNNQTYAAFGAQVYKWSEVNKSWTAVGAARSTTITDLCPAMGYLFIGLGDSTNYDIMDTGESYAAGASPGRLFFHTGEYLWRAVGINAYYTADAVTWIGPIPVGPSHYSIRAFAEHNEYTYVVTDEGLFVINDADVAVGVTPFGGASSSNGVDTIVHGDAIYIPVLGQFLMYQAGALRNIWAEVRQDELPSLAAGRVIGATTMVNWPVILVGKSSSEGHDSVWAWQDEGWHHLATLPARITAQSVRYDRANSSLWIGTTAGLAFRIHVPDYLRNPRFDATHTYMPFGWYETAWFYGGILDVEKDIESLWVRGRSLGLGKYLDVYWQDDRSYGVFHIVDETGEALADESGDELGDTYDEWFYLGRYDQDLYEIRFTGVNRPATREFRLGFLLVTTSSSDSPKIEAHRIKYQVMIQDWRAWTLPILVSGNTKKAQEMLGGTVNAYTATEQLEHLDSLAIGRSIPFTFLDLDGHSYEVKIQDAAFSPDKIEYIDGVKVYDGIYSLTLIEAHDNEAA